jgi:hypothetical protein
MARVASLVAVRAATEGCNVQLSVRKRVDARLPDSEQAQDFQSVVWCLENGFRDRAEAWYQAKVAKRDLPRIG